jgi:pimeloyl-ACP methyl ester carboxylesterase
VSSWRDFPDALCRRTGCGGVVYSRYGHGKSAAIREPLPVTFMHDEAQRVLPALLNALQIRAPILIGHSDGASIALIYAGSAADPPAALILEAPHVFVEDVTIAGIEAARSRFHAGTLRARLAEHHGANVDPMFEAWAGVWLRPEFRSWNIEEYLPRIAAPTLVVQGLQDEYGTLRQVEAVVTRLPRGSQSLVLAACRHSPHVDQRAAVEDAMARFIGDV